MAQLIDLGPDRRFESLGEGVSQGVENFFVARRKKKLEKKFDEAFDRINKAESYETAVASMSDVDPEILTDKEAIGMLSEQITRRFPEQEKEDVYRVDPITGTRKRETITFPKGRPRSDEELAKTGIHRGKNIGVGTFLANDEETGEIDVIEDVTLDEAKTKYPKRLVIPAEDASSAASLKNALANLESARAQKKAAEATASEARIPKQFDQEVMATSQRLGADYNNPEQRNSVVNVVTNTEPARKSYMELLTKEVGMQIVMNASDTGGPVAIGAELIEPVLYDGGSPADATKAAYAGFAWSALNQRGTDPDGKPAVFEPQMRVRLAAEFATITGFAHNDPIIQKAVKEVTANGSLQPGQSGTLNVYDEQGKHLGSLTLANVSGRIIPISGLRD